MSASNPVPSANAGGYEPSMEEILASIRRIIADDQSIPKAVAAEALPPREPETVPAPAPVHRLHVEAPPTPAVESDLPESSSAKSLHPEPFAPNLVSPEVSIPEPSAPGDVSPEAMTPQGTVSAPQYPMPDAPPVPTASAADPVLPASSKIDAPSAAPTVELPFHRVEAGPSILMPGAGSLFSADTNKSVTSAFNALAVSRLADNSDELMAIARDMIRPLLRSWIDDNLPTMVERMVRDEIERVARGGS